MPFPRFIAPRFLPSAPALTRSRTRAEDLAGERLVWRYQVRTKNFGPLTDDYSSDSLRSPSCARSANTKAMFTGTTAPVSLASGNAHDAGAVWPLLDFDSCAVVLGLSPFIGLPVLMQPKLLLIRRDQSRFWIIGSQKGLFSTTLATGIHLRNSWPATVIE